MPYAWNLRDDWPPASLPRDDAGNPIDLFSEPLRSDALILDVGLEVASNGVKTLVINTPREQEVLSMVPGDAEFDVATYRLTLTTDVFTAAGAGSLVGRRSAPYPVIWFSNWITAGRIPRKIIYENVSSSGSLSVPEAGVTIGQTMDDPLRIRIEYADSTETDPRCMHPSEFFSLLFWNEQGDPCFRDPGTGPHLRADDSRLEQYEHSLLDRMMLSRANGSEGTLEHNDWLGLKPPLRTYKRVEWEARKAHIFHHANWQTAGSLSGIIQNPLIRNRPPCYAGSSKCNIFVGEMAFRSGFRVYAVRAAGTAAPPLRYLTGGALVAPCISSDCDRQNLRATPGAVDVTWNGTRYSLNLPFGMKRYVASAHEDSINQDIADGKVIYFARRAYCRNTGGGADADPGPSGSCPDSTYVFQHFHVVILSHLGTVGSATLWPGTLRLDQHCERDDIPIACSLPYCGYRDASAKAFVELIPGGDPTEEWGIVNLNCLTPAP